MSSKEEIQVKISADVEPLQKEMSELNKKLRSTGYSLKQVEQALRLDPTNVDALNKKFELTQRLAEQTTQKLKLMKQRLEQMKENGENITNAQEFEKLQIEIMKTESSLKKASNAKEMFENGFKTATIINAFSNVKNAIDSVINTVMKIGNGIYETANVYAELEAESAKFNS